MLTVGVQDWFNLLPRKPYAIHRKHPVGPDCSGFRNNRRSPRNRARRDWSRCAFPQPEEKVTPTFGSQPPAFAGGFFLITGRRPIPAPPADKTPAPVRRPSPPPRVR